MKNITVISATLLSIVSLTSIFCVTFAALSGQSGCAPLFNDEFNDPVLNYQKWSTSYGSGGNGERQYYAPDAFRLADGILNIDAEQRSSHGYPYTSGIITTKDSFSHQYGYFEIRARLPVGQGFWPAFWLLPIKSHPPDEIDVFELLGNDPYTIHMSNHWNDPQGKYVHTTQTFTSPTDLTKGFHTYAIDWSQTEIKWSVDGITRFSTTQGIPSVPMFLLANFAVGGHWPGNPDNTTKFPGIMQIDYIRVYKESCSPAVTATP